MGSGSGSGSLYFAYEDDFVDQSVLAGRASVDGEFLQAR